MPWDLMIWSALCAIFNKNKIMTEKAIKNLKLKEFNFESTGINFSN